jgi:hypothetical protein
MLQCNALIQTISFHILNQTKQKKANNYSPLHKNPNQLFGFYLQPIFHNISIGDGLNGR